MALELIAAGVKEITVVNRTESRASELAGLLQTRHQVPASAVTWQGEYAVPLETDALINATSIGGENASKPHTLLFDSLRPELLVVDVSTNPPQTELLHEAALHKCKTVNGLSILIEQIAAAITLWTGLDPAATCSAMRRKST